MKTEKAYFAGGCFWCLEASFRLVPGVVEVISGYAGGSTKSPSYDQVSSGMTGHTETVEVEYDPAKVSYDKLLELFFKLHDPSQKDRQGNDIGTQYRSAIFYTSEEQQKLAEAKLTELKESGIYREVFTELLPLEYFWPAEDYHQYYFEKHPDQAYCQMVVRPKIEKTVEYLEKR